MVNVVYRQKVKINPADVRNMCIRNNFYTRGDCAEYENMFELCSKYDGDIADLTKIAWDIVEHSDSDELEDYGFDSVYEIVAWISTMILKECSNTFISVEEVE